jgi:hypothetical protein
MEGTGKKKQKNARTFPADARKELDVPMLPFSGGIHTCITPLASHCFHVVLPSAPSKLHDLALHLLGANLFKPDHGLIQKTRAHT